MSSYYISLGPNCHAAGNLRNLKNRSFSSPFDWNLTKENFGIQYVNDNINNNFEFYAKDLEYNDKNKVISKHYPNSVFFHHNPLKDNSLIETFSRRTKRFMDLISEPNNIITFLYYYQLTEYNQKKKFDILFKSIKELENNNKIKSKFKLVIYVANDDNDFDLNLWPEIKELKKTVFVKYIRVTSVSKTYGRGSDFQKLLKKVEQL